MLQPYDGIPDGDSARSVVEVMARSWAEPALGNDQGDEQPEPVATTASDATSGTRSMLAFRSVVSVLVSFVVRNFSTNSRPALRAAPSDRDWQRALLRQRLRGVGAFVFFRHGWG